MPGIRIPQLVAAHLLCSPFWFLSKEPFAWRSVLFLSVLFAQTTLLATSLATNSRVRRLGAAGFVILAIEFFVAQTFDHGVHDLGLLVMLAYGSALAVAAAMFGMQILMSIDFIYLSENAAEQPDGPKFSIGHLLIFTAVVGGVLAARQIIPESKNLPVILLVFAVIIIVVPMASVWAALSVARPLAPCLFALLLAVAVGQLPRLYFDRYNGEPWFWSAVFGLQGAICIGSLLVVRSCGYRLARAAAAKAPLDARDA